jgi:dihydroxy-acid dehydratase
VSVYSQPTDPGKRRSAKLTDGVDRAPARAMLKAVGFTDEDLAKPRGVFAKYAAQVGSASEGAPT